MASTLVKINNGHLRGCYRKNIDNNTFLAFLGIPYAQPPVGDLRFKAPVPVGSWSGIKDATKDGNSCYTALGLNDDIIGGSEDCLNLNVFTKKLPQQGDDPKPVMVWIHGGAFTRGSNKISLFGPQFLMTEDIVLVSINYRLGLLGFLSFEDPSLDVPGNAGFKDQVLALKWVQENIRYFNGDPNNVTLFGQSAGACSIHFHILSPSSKGLFHRAILQSGSAFNHWAYGSPNAKKLTDSVGYDAKSDREVYEILKNLPVEKLYEVQQKFEELSKIIRPVNQRLVGLVTEYPNRTEFLTKKVMDIIRSGEYNKVPMMFGYNDMEGKFVELIKIINNDGNKGFDLESNIPIQMGLQKDRNDYELICQKLKNLYSKSADTRHNICTLATDIWFFIGTMAAVRNHMPTTHEPIYLYRMSLVAGLNSMKHVELDAIRGVCHSDELGYLFNSDATPDIKPGSLEDISIRRFVTLWTNFAKYGNPTPTQELGVTWEPIADGQFKFLDIGEKLVFGTNPDMERIDVWKEILDLNPETCDLL